MTIRCTLGIVRTWGPAMLNPTKTSRSSVESRLGLSWRRCGGRRGGACGQRGERFEVGPLDGDADGDVAVFHFVNAFGAGVVGKPIFAVDIFAIGFEHIERQSWRLQRAQVGNPLAVGFHHFQILLVDPDDAVEKRVLAVESFRCDLKDIAIDFIDLLGVEVGEIVLGEIGLADGKRRNAREELRVFGFELQVLQRRGGGFGGFFVELAIAGTGGIVGGNELPTGTPVWTEFLDANGFAVGILRARVEVDIFFFGEALNDLRRREGGGGLRFEDSGDALDFMLGGRGERAGGIFLGDNRARGRKQYDHERDRNKTGDAVTKAEIRTGHILLDATHCTSAARRVWNPPHPKRSGFVRIVRMEGPASEHINLWKKQLGNAPDWVWEREDAETLVLADSGLREISGRIGQLKKLRMLDLGHNELESVPESLGELAGLTDFLYLHDNRLSELPASLSRLTGLRYLNIGENRFEQIPECVCGMAGLVELQVSGNRIERLPDSLSRLARLRELHCRNSRLSSLPGSIGELAELRQIHLRGNPLRKLPAELAAMPRLEKLDLRWGRDAGVAGVARGVGGAGVFGVPVKVGGVVGSSF